MPGVSSWIARAVAAVTAAAAVAGCHFAVVPPKKHPHATAYTRSGQAALRLSDAPPLVVQCAISRAGLRPVDQGWLDRGSVRISAGTAAGFELWWRGHDTPGPYRQMFRIDGHLTHYLAFGATWVRQRGQWVPTHTAAADPAARRTSLYAYAVWTAANDRLPPAVCGSSVSIHRLQAQVFGSRTPDPW